MEQTTIQNEAKEFKAPKTANDFLAGEHEIKHTYPNGNAVVFVLLTNGKVATVREGKGTDVEKAQMEAAGNQSKYMTSMMAATITIEGLPVNMFDVSEMPMKDYMRLQVAFADINF